VKLRQLDVRILSAGVLQVDGRLVNLFVGLWHRLVVNDGCVVCECRNRRKTHAFEVIIRAAQRNSPWSTYWQSMDKTKNWCQQTLTEVPNEMQFFRKAFYKPVSSFRSKCGTFKIGSFHCEFYYFSTAVVYIIAKFWLQFNSRNSLTVCITNNVWHTLHVGQLAEESNARRQICRQGGGEGWHCHLNTRRGRLPLYQLL